MKRKTEREAVERWHLSRGRRTGESRKDLRELGEAGRLHDHFGGAQRHRLAGLLVPGMSREDHNGNQRVATPDPGENGQAAEPRHDEVEKDPLNGSGFQYPQALGAIERDERLVTEGADRLRDHLGDGRIIIHHKYSHGSRRLAVSGPAAGSSRPSGSSRP